VGEPCSQSPCLTFLAPAPFPLRYIILLNQDNPSFTVIAVTANEVFLRSLLLFSWFRQDSYSSLLFKSSPSHLLLLLLHLGRELPLISVEVSRFHMADLPIICVVGVSPEAGVLVPHIAPLALLPLLQQFRTRGFTGESSFEFGQQVADAVIRLLSALTFLLRVHDGSSRFSIFSCFF